jgi:hypothetical protein
MTLAVMTPPWQSLSLTHCEQPFTVQYDGWAQVLVWLQVFAVTLPHLSIVQGKPSSQSASVWHWTQPS